jgi:hypothetical protein
VDEPLVEVGDDGVLIDDFVDFVHLNGAYFIDDEEMSGLGISADAVLVDLFEVEYLAFV